MKVKSIVLAAAIALLGTSVAVAAPPSGKGKPPATGAGCKPNVAVVLKGTLGGNGAAAPFSLAVNVTGGNHFATAYKNHSISIQVATSTKVHRQGDSSSTALKSGDKVNIQAKACKADLANNATPSLTASRIDAHPAT
jgi:hypothetical protein